MNDADDDQRNHAEHERARCAAGLKMIEYIFEDERIESGHRRQHERQHQNGDDAPAILVEQAGAIRMFQSRQHIAASVQSVYESR